MEITTYPSWNLFFNEFVNIWNTVGPISIILIIVMVMVVGLFTAFFTIFGAGLSVIIFCIYVWRGEWAMISWWALCLFCSLLILAPTLIEDWKRERRWNSSPNDELKTKD